MAELKILSLCGLLEGDITYKLAKSGIVKDGDVVKFDAGVNAEFDFYTTDTSRAWIIGNGDPALMKLKDRLYEGQRRSVSFLWDL